MSSATALKFRDDAKQLAAKRLRDRKRSLLVLILRHLADSGYVQACKQLESEANLTLDQVRTSGDDRLLYHPKLSIYLHAQPDSVSCHRLMLRKTWT